MIVLIHLCWLLAGSALSGVLGHPTSARIVNLSLAAALVIATVAALVD